MKWWLQMVSADAVAVVVVACRHKIYETVDAQYGCSSEQTDRVATAGAAAVVASSVLAWLEQFARIHVVYKSADIFDA